jgi:hypothetical protein
VLATEKIVHGIQDVVELFTKERATLKGMMLAVSLLSGFLAWGSSFLFSLLMK